jgi:hypothetical protein
LEELVAVHKPSSVSTISALHSALFNILIVSLFYMIRIQQFILSWIDFEKEENMVNIGKFDTDFYKETSLDPFSSQKSEKVVFFFILFILLYFFF